MRALISPAIGAVTVARPADSDAPSAIAVAAESCACAAWYAD